MKIDDQGRLDFSRKALLEKPEGWTPPPKRDRNQGNRGWILPKEMKIQLTMHQNM